MEMVRFDGSKPSSAGSSGPASNLTGSIRGQPGIRSRQHEGVDGQVAGGGGGEGAFDGGFGTGGVPAEEGIGFKPGPALRSKSWKAFVCTTRQRTFCQRASCHGPRR